MNDQKTWADARGDGRLILEHLQQWNRSLNDFTRASAALGPDKADLPYWYNERVDVGFLASAIWRSGGVVLEEYSTRRVEGRKTFPGRADIWWMTRDGRSVAAEC